MDCFLMPRVLSKCDERVQEFIRSDEKVFHEDFKFLAFRESVVYLEGMLVLPLAFVALRPRFKATRGSNLASLCGAVAFNLYQYGTIFCDPNRYHLESATPLSRSLRDIYRVEDPLGKVYPLCKRTRWEEFDAAKHLPDKNLSTMRCPQALRRWHFLGPLSHKCRSVVLNHKFEHRGGRMFPVDSQLYRSHTITRMKQNLLFVATLYACRHTYGQAKERFPVFRVNAEHSEAAMAKVLGRRGLSVVGFVAALFVLRRLLYMTGIMFAVPYPEYTRNPTPLGKDIRDLYRKYDMACKHIRAEDRAEWDQLDARIEEYTAPLIEEMRLKKLEKTEEKRVREEAKHREVSIEGSEADLQLLERVAKSDPKPAKSFWDDL